MEVNEMTEGYSCGEKRVHTLLMQSALRSRREDSQDSIPAVQREEFQEDTVHDTDASEVKQEKDLGATPGLRTEIGNFKICSVLGGLHKVQFTKNDQFAHEKVKRTDSN